MQAGNDASTGSATLEPATGAQQLLAAQQGDREAFTAIVEEHQQAVYGYLRTRLFEPSDAEDLCQEVFLRCFQGREKFSRAAALRPWIIGVARNVLREHVRRMKRRKEVAWARLCMQLDELEKPVEEKAGDEALDHLPDCIGSLAEHAREAIQLKYQQRMRMAEIGRKMARSEGAIKLLMHRARRALRTCLGVQLGEARYE